jgi:hypothetical protein
MPSIASALPFHSSLPLEVNNRKPGESDLRKTLSTRRTNRVYRQATQIAGEIYFHFPDSARAETRHTPLDLVRHERHRCARGDLLDSRFSINVVSFSRNVVLSGPSFSINSVPKLRMLSVRVDYVLSSLHVIIYSAIR